jgi:hypothetical protein
MSIHRFVKIECDVCAFVGPELHSLNEAGAYILAGADGKWTTTEERLICRGCIIDRACRIFGHRVRITPHPFEGQLACARCQTFIEVS